MIDICSTALAFVVAIFLWRFFLVEYPNLIVDWTRQRLFEIRDAMFDAAIEGTIPFESEGYWRTRGVLNKFIRHLHRFAWIHIAVMLALHWAFRDANYVNQYRQKHENAIGQLPPKAREIAKFADSKGDEVLAQHLLMVSPAVTLLLLPLLTLFFALILVATWVMSFIMRTISKATLKQRIHRFWTAFNYEVRVAIF